MKKVSYVLLFLVVLLCSLTVVFGAYSYDMSVVPFKNDIFVNESAIFNLTVNNSENVADTFKFSTDDFMWNIYSDPLSDKFGGLKVPANSFKSTTLLITPARQLVGGKYKVEFTLQSENSGDAIKTYLEVGVRSLKPIIPVYEPQIKVDLELSDNGTFDPRYPATVKVILKNKNALELSNIDITLKSNVIDKERTGLMLDPLEKRTEEFSISFNPFEKPQKDTLLVSVSVGNKTFVALQPYEISLYHVPFDQKIVVAKKFLVRIQQITVTNPSNVYEQEAVMYKAPLITGMFSSSQPKGEITRANNKRYLMWNLGLNPQESRTLIITYNYRPLVIIICLIIVGFVFYFAIRSPLIVRKRVSNIYTKEGGISKLRLQISVRNRGSETVHDVKVIDTIPSIAEVIREFQLGSLQPSKVVEREKKSTLIMWNISSIEPNEERLISYDIKSRLSIIGELNMNSAHVKYKNKQGREYSTNSNVLTVNMKVKATLSE